MMKNLHQVWWAKYAPHYWDRVNVSENLGVTVVINKSPLRIGWKQKEFGLVQKHSSVSFIEKPYLLDLQSMNRQQKR